MCTTMTQSVDCKDQSMRVANNCNLTKLHCKLTQLTFLVRLICQCPFNHTPVWNSENITIMNNDKQYKKVVKLVHCSNS